MLFPQELMPVEHTRRAPTPMLRPDAGQEKPSPPVIRALHRWKRGDDGAVELRTSSALGLRTSAFAARLAESEKLASSATGPPHRSPAH